MDTDNTFFFFVKGFPLKIVKQLCKAVLYKAVNYFANIPWDEEAEGIIDLFLRLKSLML